MGKYPRRKCSCFKTSVRECVDFSRSRPENVVRFNRGRTGDSIRVAGEAPAPSEEWRRGWRDAAKIVKAVLRASTFKLCSGCNGAPAKCDVL